MLGWHGMGKKKRALKDYIFVDLFAMKNLIIEMRICIDKFMIAHITVFLVR